MKSRMFAVMLSCFVMLIMCESRSVADSLLLEVNRAQCSSIVDEIILENDKQQESSASPGYGCLGAFQGCLFGFSLTASEGTSKWVPLAAMILGVSVGSYLGYTAEGKLEKGALIAGAVIAVPVVFFAIGGIGN